MMLARNDQNIPIDLLRHAEALAIEEWGADALRPIGPHLTELLPLEPATDLQRRWHVVQTEPQQETDVSKRLEKEWRLDVFCPREPKRVRVSAYKHRTIMRAMLPGYLFVGFDVMWDRWQIIHDVRGVVRILMVDLRPVPIMQGVIDHLRRKEIELAGGRCRKHPPITLVVQTLVRILDPLAFAGLFGHIIEIDDKKHLLCTEIDIFGRKVKLSLAPEQVEAI
jgi:transcription antitermination factor NusG